ncbi:T9SS type A sorting domain-containing protein [Flavobacterium sp. N1994]|uniref:T9SS type A sorting domain-containing protein n=1 Tax=Flavobacterium sp. N1994 TaxID=2986827 RepID=UPI00222340B6|nr:T9SS type A sorting domain-containing protein [Flavobacterium sp. N1994]
MLQLLPNTTSTTVALLNVSELESNTVSITPIPVTDVLEIRALETITSVQLFDIQGRLLQVKTTDSLSTTLDFTGKSSGVYLVKVLTSKGMKVQKVIKN